MKDEITAEERAAAYAAKPYAPAPNVAPEHRVANALHYIALQLWRLNANLEKLHGDKK